MTVERVGVIGGGQMGAGIAEVAAAAGCNVVVHEVSAEAAEAARGRIARSIDRSIDRGRLQPAERDTILGRIGYSTDYDEQADRQIVVEAVIEDEALKRQVFGVLDSVVTDENAILASNTSSIPITRLATATNRPDHVVGLHFFNPVPAMGLVELVTTPLSDGTVEGRAEQFAADQLGKTVIRAKDRGGFVVNLLLVPYLLAAIRLYEAGHATAADIDTAMKLGANHPMGPLELCDFIGLDTMKLVADVLFDEYKEPLYSSPPLLTRMVEAGMLGRKSGQGFYGHGG
ncbi:MAG TPA: 3-hydroxybutyryl-CoA dehydrogenase [Acidimicrobiia bacterium]|nr:3-hydroxybutyryl-CoA dehydrogenase [Acidimicrobiia bacterium]